MFATTYLTFIKSRPCKDHTLDYLKNSFNDKRTIKFQKQQEQIYLKKRPSKNKIHEVAINKGITLN